MSDEPSFIVKRRDLAEIIQNPDKDAIEELLEDPAAVLAASLTDLFTTPTAYIQRGVRIVQAAFKADIFRQFGREIRLLREKGKLAEDFERNKYGYQTWVELLSVIDEETPDEERLEALKAMFLACNKVNATDADHILGYQLFQIAKRLTSNELLILKATYELNNNISDLAGIGHYYSSWVNQICRYLGHHVSSLVSLADDALVKNQLLTARLHGGASIETGKSRLTDLGFVFCKNIETYRIEKKAM